MEKLMEKLPKTMIEESLQENQQKPQKTTENQQKPTKTK